MNFSLTKSGSVLRMSVVAALFAMAANAQAASIIGELDLAGRLTQPTNLSTDMSPKPLTTVVIGGSGAFNDVYYASPNLAQFSFPIPTNPSVILFSYDDGTGTGNKISFTLNSASLTTTQTTSGYTLWGLGNFTDTIGDDPTLASFSFGTSHATNGGYTYTANFASPAVYPTPVPAALLFVAPALAGVFGFSRRKNGAKSAA